MSANPPTTGGSGATKRMQPALKRPVGGPATSLCGDTIKSFAQLESLGVSAAGGCTFSATASERWKSYMRFGIGRGAAGIAMTLPTQRGRRRHAAGTKSRRRKSGNGSVVTLSIMLAQRNPRECIGNGTSGFEASTMRRKSSFWQCVPCISSGSQDPNGGARSQSRPLSPPSRKKAS
jgi:hypothetical protein